MNSNFSSSATIAGTIRPLIYRVIDMWLLKLFVLIAFVGCVGCGWFQPSLSANVATPAASAINVTEPTPTPIDDVSVLLGCWSGMRGGRVEITSNKIFDRNHNESAGFKVVVHKPAKGTSFADLEEYLLEADRDFPRSFLARFIRIKLGKDDYGRLDVGFITSYDSLKDYEGDDASGEGFFQRMPCEVRPR